MNAQLSIVPKSDAGSPLATHIRLAAFNGRRLKPTYATSRWRDDLVGDLSLLLEEGEFVESERRGISHLLVEAPTNVDEFMAWFELLKKTGPGQNDPLFPWLAKHATREQMCWFLTQEIAGEAGFDDLVALTQVRFPVQPKLEMARNYWDEMGRGHEKGMHGGMLERTAQELQLQPRVEDTAWESLSLANLMAALASNRRYAYQSVGALGVVELTAPGRVSLVNEGLQRLDISPIARQYFQLHAGLDVRHSLAWNKEVIQPLITADLRAALPIAEGALMRLRCGQRCFEKYRQQFGLTPS